MCDCANSLSLTCLCRMNFTAIREHDPDAESRDRQITRTNYQLSPENFFFEYKKTDGRWEYPLQNFDGSDGTNGADDCVSITDGTRLYVVGLPDGAFDGTSTGKYLVQCFEMEGKDPVLGTQPKKLWEVLTPNGLRTSFIQAWLAVGPWGLDVYQGGSIGPTSSRKCRISPTGSVGPLVDLYGGATPTLVTFPPNRYNSGAGAVVRTAPKPGGGFQTFVGLMNAQGIMSGGDAITAGNAGEYDGGIYYSSNAQSVVPWGNFGFATGSSLASFHEVYPKGFAAAYTYARTTSGALLRSLSFKDDVYDWTVPLQAANGDPYVGTVTILDSDETSLWISLGDTAKPGLLFPDIFPPTTPHIPANSSPPAMIIRLAKDKRSADVFIQGEGVGFSAEAINESHQQVRKRLDCLDKSTPDQYPPAGYPAA